MEYSKKISENIYLALVAIIFVLPFPKGLFFESEILYMEWVVFTLFVIFSISNIVIKRKIYLNSSVSFIALMLPVAYLLPIITGNAVNKTSSFYYFMRYISYFLVFLIAKESINTKKQLKIAMYVVAVSSVLCGLLGIDSLAGGQIGTILKFKDIGFLEGYNRLYGVMQYPNTSAIYYGISFILLTVLSILENKRILKAAIGGIMFIPFIAIFLTISRSAILSVGVSYILLFLILPDKKSRIEFVLVTFAPIVVSLIAYQPLVSASPIEALAGELGSTSKIWTISVVCIIVTSIATYVLLLLTDILNKISSKVYITAIIILAVLLSIGGIGIFSSGLYEKILPQSILSRFKQTGEMATSGRTTFYSDALKLIKDNWLLGTGGGGWKSMYRMYQSYPYGSTEAHSMILQVWIETGIFGVALYTMMIVSTVIVYIKSLIYKKNTVILSGIIAVLAMVVGQSMVDFSFSYFSVPCIVFFLLGCIDNISSEFSDFKFKIALRANIVFGIVPLIVATSFFISRAIQTQAQKMIDEAVFYYESLYDIKDKLELATFFNPLGIDLYIDERGDDISLKANLISVCTEILNYDSTDRDILKLFEKSAKKSLWLNSKSPDINDRIGTYYIESSLDKEYGLECLDKALEYDPLSPYRYEKVAANYYDVGMIYINHNQKQEGLKYIQRVTELSSEASEAEKSSIKEISLINFVTVDYIIKANDIIIESWDWDMDGEM